MDNIGFKKLSIENWLQPDEASTLFVTLTIEGIRPLDGEAGDRVALIGL